MIDETEPETYRVKVEGCAIPWAARVDLETARKYACGISQSTARRVFVETWPDGRAVTVYSHGRRLALAAATGVDP